MRVAFGIAMVGFAWFLFGDHFAPDGTIWPYVWWGVLALGVGGYSFAFVLVKLDDRRAASAPPPPPRPPPNQKPKRKIRK